MNDTRTSGPVGLLGDFRLLLILFIAFRIMMMMVYQPLLIEQDTSAEPPAESETAGVEVADVAPGVERGVGTMGDRRYHFALAALTERGDWPFIDWWSEFPPVWYGITTLVYQTQGEDVSYTGWSIWLGIIVLAFDVGNLVLMRRIGTWVYGANTGMGLAWIYALTLAPMVFAFWNFEPIVAFFLLFGLDALLRRRDTGSALGVALGALTKFTPALLLGAVIRFRSWQSAVRYIAIAVGVFAVIYAGLYGLNAAKDGDPAIVTASLTSQFNKASYQSVWALIDGNYTTGNFGSVASHYDADAANNLYGEPAVVPGWLRLAVAGAIGLFVLIRTRRFDDRGVVAFTGITLLIFFLQAQGWSPQWLSQIIPLVLLAFPSRNGVLVTVLLSVLTFTEYPVLFLRTGETGGEISGALVGPFAGLVLARTFLLAAVVVALYGLLRQEPTQPMNDD